MANNITGISRGLGLPKRFLSGGEVIPVPPSLKEKLVTVVSSYGKTNSDYDREIIKDLTGNGNNFKATNFKWNPTVDGYGRYYYDWSGYSSDAVRLGTATFKSRAHNKVVFENITTSSLNLFYAKATPRPAHRVTFRITGINKPDTGNSIDISIKNTPDLSGSYQRIYSGKGGGLHTVNIPESTIIVVTIYTVTSGDTNFPTEASIEHFPEYDTGLVTDGASDLIVSENPMSEMMGDATDITVVSMIKQLSPPINNANVVRNNFTGYKTGPTTVWIDSKVPSTEVGKTGIYGYTKTEISSTSAPKVIDNILGDKADYTSACSTDPGVLDEFSVTGYRRAQPAETIYLPSQVIWYWTIIAKAVLTESEINQVIECYNLDRPGEVVKPLVYYDNYKQGMTNSNHATKFSDLMLDLSGNKFHASLTNMAFGGGSGVSKYPENFKNWYRDTTKSKNFWTSDSEIHFRIESRSSAYGLVYLYPKHRDTDIESFRVRVNTINDVGSLTYNYTDEAGNSKAMSLRGYSKDEVIVLPKSYITKSSGAWTGFHCSIGGGEFIISQVPEYEGAWVFDGIDDHAKVEGLPILKDYTVAAFREWINLPTDTAYGLASKRLSGPNLDGAFILEQHNTDDTWTTYSFGGIKYVTKNIDLTNPLVWQTKYNYCGDNSIPVGSYLDTGSLFLGMRGNYFGYGNVALRAFMIFPYSMSKFLLDRQLNYFQVSQKIWSPGKEIFNLPGYNGKIEYWTTGKDGEAERLMPGQSYTPGAPLSVRIYLQDPDDSIDSVTYGDTKFPKITLPNTDGGNNYFEASGLQLSHQSGIGISVDIIQFIKFEDIGNPYPLVINELTAVTGETYGPDSNIPVGTVLKYPSFRGQFPSTVLVPGSGMFYNGIKVENTSTFTFTTIKGEIMKFTMSPIPMLAGGLPQFLITPTPEPGLFTNPLLQRLGYFPDMTDQGNNLDLSEYDWSTGLGITETTTNYSNGLPGFSSSKGGTAGIIKTTKGIKTLFMKLFISNPLDQLLFVQGWGMYISVSGDPAYSDAMGATKIFLDGEQRTDLSISDLIGRVHTVAIVGDSVPDEAGNIKLGTSGTSEGGDIIWHAVMGFDYILSDAEIKSVSGDLANYADYIKFNPTLEISGGTMDLVKSFKYRDQQNTESVIEPGILFPKTRYSIPNLEIEFNLPSVEALSCTFGGIDCEVTTDAINKRLYIINPRRIDDFGLLRQEYALTIKNPMRVEYIEQPYPYFIDFYRSGRKLRQGEDLVVGEQVTIEISNRMPGLYEATGVTLNGAAVENESTVTVDFGMKFECTGKKWLLKTVPEPLWAYEAAVISESTLLYLGHLPDLTGHGNHMKLVGFKEGMSQAKDQYEYNFVDTSLPENVEVLFRSIGEITFKKTTTSSQKIFSLGNPYSRDVDIYFNSDIEIKQGTATVEYIGSSGVLKTISLVPGHNVIPHLEESTGNIEVHLTITEAGTYNIRQVGRRQGSLRFMHYYNELCYGVIPESTSESLCCLVTRLFWEDQGIIFDQLGENSIRISTEGELTDLAYTKNNYGKVWISNTPNSYITLEDLKNVSHNISVTLDAPISPLGGGFRFSCGLSGTGQCTTDLYSMIGFSKIPSDYELGIINTWAGLKASVELPSYYWDVAGKSNVVSEDIDGNREKIYNQVPLQLQNELPESEALDLKNFSFSGLSGYGGYVFDNFNNTKDWKLNVDENGIEVVSRNGYSATCKRIGSGARFWDYHNPTIKTLSKDLIVNVQSDSAVYIRWEFKYKEPGKDVHTTKLISRTKLIPNTPTRITLSRYPEEEIEAVENSQYYFFYFDPTDIPIGQEYTIELLPEYRNGLVFDGVDDKLENKLIPEFSDYTIIAKRIFQDATPDGQNIHSSFITKGAKNVNGGEGNAFIFEYTNGNYVNIIYSLGGTAAPKRETGDISYATPTSYNGIPLTPGTGTDNPGIQIGCWSNFWKGVFWKAILYKKTIDTLSIKLLQNLMAIPDYIINMENPIFMPSVIEEPDPGPTDPNDFKGFLTTYPKQPQGSKVVMVITEDYFQVTSISGTNAFFLERHPTDILVNSYNILVEGLTDSGLRMVYRRIREDGTNQDIYITEDGTYTVEPTLAISPNYNIGFRLLNMNSWGNVDLPSCNIKVTWIK